MEQNKDLFDRLFSAKCLQRFLPCYRRYKEPLLYIFFGAVTTLVSLGTFALFTRLFGWNALLANVLSWVLSVFTAFITNRLWVFDSHIRGWGLWREIGLFFGGRLLTLGIEEVMLIVFVEYMKLNDLLIKILATIVVLVLNYIFSKLVVFKKK